MAQVNIRLTNSALNDIQQIEDYFSESAASKKINLIMEKIEELKLQPWRGRPIPEWADENIRYLQAKDYKIIYHVVDEFLLRVLRVFPYKMDFNPDRDLDFE